MTGTNATTWKQATLNASIINDKRKTVALHNADAPSLSINGMEFLPDYYRNENSTHYYRLVDNAENAKRNSIADFTELNSLLDIAGERVSEKNAWAPHGYARLQQAMAGAQAVIKKGKKNVSADEVETATASLNKAINTMRPSNLAEMEDLQPLSTLLRRAGTPDESSSKALKDAVAYGKMVMRYVTDGSGTKDMISNAVDRLKTALGQ